MRTVFGIPWILFAIRVFLLLTIPALLVLVPSEGGSAGYALWWGGIVFIAFLMVHWRDLALRPLAYALGGAVLVWGLCYGAWALGKALHGLPSAKFDAAYPSVSAGINEMLLAFYVVVAFVHVLIDTALRRRQ